MSPRGRTAARVALVALATVVGLEVGSCALMRLGFAGAPPEELAAALPESIGEGESLRTGTQGVPNVLRQYVLHPYVGFVRNRAIKNHVLNNIPIETPVNDEGFFGPAPGPLDPGTFVVGVTGGSVAAELYLHAGDLLAERLATLPQAAGRPVRLVSFALGGFKQPQQLEALAYFLGRGDHFDLVINLDGFNEVVLPWAENRRMDTSPVYPRMWRVFTARSIDAGSAVLYGRIFDVKDRIEQSRAFYARFPYRYSQLMRLVWALSYARLSAEQRSLEDSLRDSLAHARSTPQEEGPPYVYGDEMFDDFAALWRNASLQMWALCRANGIEYEHFLQPNQYVPDSKRFTAEERRLAVGRPGSSYREGVELGYPHLLTEAARLREAGAPFVDLTPLFADEAGTVYRDRCCHLTERGNALVVDAIVRALATSRGR